MDLSTTYLGKKLKSPLVPSASPLSSDESAIKLMEDSGAGAVVLESLFEEQILHEKNEMDHYLAKGTDSFAESLSYFPESDMYNFGPDEYLNHIRKAKDAVDIPIIASLNGVSTGGWIEYARKMQQAGADAIELNSYYLATDPAKDSRTIEDNYVEILSEVKKTVTIPVALKLSPFFTSLSAMAKRFDEAGAAQPVQWSHGPAEPLRPRRSGLRPLAVNEGGVGGMGDHCGAGRGLQSGQAAGMVRVMVGDDYALDVGRRVPQPPDLTENSPGPPPQTSVDERQPVAHQQVHVRPHDPRAQGPAEPVHARRNLHRPASAYS